MLKAGLSLLVILSVIVGGSPAGASSQSKGSSPSEILPMEAPLDEVEQAVEDLALELLLEEPRLCCQLPSLHPSSVNTLAGLLFWSRLRILCKGLYTTAIC
jgi:hypothetical protein